MVRLLPTTTKQTTKLNICIYIYSVYSIEIEREREVEGCKSFGGETQKFSPAKDEEKVRLLLVISRKEKWRGHHFALTPPSSSYARIVVYTIDLGSRAPLFSLFSIGKWVARRTPSFVVIGYFRCDDTPVPRALNVCSIILLPKGPSYSMNMAQLFAIGNTPTNMCLHACVRVGGPLRSINRTRAEHPVHEPSTCCPICFDLFFYCPKSLALIVRYTINRNDARLFPQLVLHRLEMWQKCWHCLRKERVDRLWRHQQIIFALILASLVFKKSFLRRASFHSSI